MHPWVWLVLSALVAGAVNSLAGGGTLLTFPALLAALAPLGTAEAAVVANMTSTGNIRRIASSSFNFDETGPAVFLR